jgi:hypothetical protein
LYRLFEILPGFLTWTTIISCFVFSWLAPAQTALFIIIFDTYWFFKTVYLSIHLRAGYKRMANQMNINWVEKLRSNDKWQNMYHLIILPMYKEGVEVVRPSFESLANNGYPLNKMIVVLAIEEKSGERGKEVSRIISREFGDKFFKFLVTTHPSDIEGEIAGKGSNETWAGRQVKKEIIDKINIPYENIIVSVFDVDTVVTSGYFGCLTYNYITHPNPTKASFQPIPLFINNIWEAPALARVISFSSTFWHIMQQERPERQVTFSSHSMSFKALAEIDFWQTNIVSEDSRIFWQNYLFYDGNYEVMPLHFTVSMDSNVSSNFWRTMVNQYKQIRRWAWGSENLAYMLFGFWKNKRVNLISKVRWSFVQFEGFWSWATNGLIIFMLGWLPLVLGGDKFNATVLSYNLPGITRIIMTLAMIGVITSAYLGIALLPPRPKIYGKHKWAIMAAQWLLIPISIIVFGAIPAIEAQTRLMLGKYMGFWTTEKVRKNNTIS